MSAYSKTYGCNHSYIYKTVDMANKIDGFKCHSCGKEWKSNAVCQHNSVFFDDARPGIICKDCFEQVYPKNDDARWMAIIDLILTRTRK